MNRDAHNESELLSSLDIHLREKLSVLLPALELLEKRVAPEGEADAAVLRYLGEARRAAFSILRLARNLGDHAKYSADYDMSEPSWADLGLLFAEIIEETDKMAAYKQISVTLTCSEKPFHAYIDGDMVSRLLYNLLSNAVLHGEGDVAVELCREDGSILFRVRSGGGGVPHFYAGQKNVEIPDGGGNSLGLGLSVASAIVCQCGGTMMTTSDERSGTVVTVSLPVTEGTDSGTLETYSEPLSYHAHLVELADFPAYNPIYNLKQRREEEPCPVKSKNLISTRGTS
jgi:signal transduction histidine kinase